ncbi:redoxin domain-containing protein [candidate division WOR-3 bacterium]|nr:redoxin domain-containing protein [candidate division WOR-3 bacterium]
MIRWFGLTLFLSISVIPLNGQETQEEVEAEVIEAVYHLQQLLRASVFFSWDDFIPTAAEIVNEALEKYPESVRLHEQLQDLTMRMLADPRLYIDKKPIQDSLVSHYEALYEENPNNASYTYLFGRVLDDTTKKLELAEIAIKKDKKSYWGYILKGDALIDLKRYDEAEVTFEKAIIIDSTRSDAYEGLVSVYFCTQRNEESVKNAIKVCELAPHQYLSQYAHYFAQKAGENIEDKNLLVELEQAYFLKQVTQKSNELYTIYKAARDVYQAYREIDQIDSVRLYLNYMEAYASPLGFGEMVDLNRAVLEASLGNNDKALGLLGKVAEAGYPYYGAVTDFPEFDILKDDPRMKELLERMKDNAREDFLAELTSKPAPDFTLTTIDGEEVRLSDLQGKVVILDFWGIGCGPCYQIMPVLERFFNDHKDELFIYGIESWNNPADKIKETLDQFGWTYPNLVGSDDVNKAYGITGVPHMFVIDPEGNVRYEHRGFAPGEGFAQQMYDQLEWLLDDLK